MLVEEASVMLRKALFFNLCILSLCLFLFHAGGVGQ